MRISLNWLRDLVDFDLPPEALADALTMAGFEVEDIEDRRTWANGVVVGQVLQCDRHPDADKLSVCLVDIGNETPSSIVCGAANVKAGIQVAVATVETYLPVIDITIKARKVRGVLSAGMICSLAEVGLAKESEGIHVFEQAGLTMGEDARPYLGLDDVVLDLTSTANRADALSMVGIAREVAAVTGAALKLPMAPSPTVSDAANPLSVELSDPKACPIYTGTVLSQIKIASSPIWLQQRLQAAGTRPINNIVDVTNYVLLEWGQPLHAFDRDRVLTVTQSDALTLGVRYANPEETLVTLDSQTRQLAAETLLITANDVPVALAGVMGGEATEVDDETQTVMLEAAYFDPAAIRRSARSQGLRTEASARYERGVNPAELEAACNRAIQLMQELAGAVVVAQASDRTESGHITPTRTLSLRLTRVNEILGPIKTAHGAASLAAADVETVLAKLGCEATATDDGGIWTVKVPPYRYRDLEREIDLVEEVARLYGYDNFADTLPSAANAGYLSPEAALARRVREAFRAAGLTELMHYSVTRPLEDKQVVIANPLFSEYSALRADLISGLIDAFQFNLEQGNGPLNGFEMGHIFWVDDAGQQEAEALGGVMGGDRRSGQWVSAGQGQPLTWYDAKGILETVFERIGLAVDFRPDSEDTRLHPGRTASLWVRGRTRLGTFGQLHPQVRQARGLPEAVYLFDLDWAVMLTCLAPTKRGGATVFKPYSTYPASDRDIAFYAPTQVSVGELTRLITKAGGKLLESVTLFDEYRGDNVPEGQRSLAFRLVYRALDRTLTDKDVEPVHQKVREALEKQFKVDLRS